MIYNRYDPFGGAGVGWLPFQNCHCAILGLVLLYAWRSDPPSERAPILVELEAEQGKLPQRKALTTPSPAAGIKAVVQPGDLIKPGTMRYFLLGAEADNQHKTLIFR